MMGFWKSWRDVKFGSRDPRLVEYVHDLDRFAGCRIVGNETTDVNRPFVVQLMKDTFWHATKRKMQNTTCEQMNGRYRRQEGN